MHLPIVLCALQLQPAFAAQRSGSSTAQLSPDLGLTQCAVQLTSQGVVFPEGEQLSWQAAEEVSANAQSSFVLKAGVVEKIQAYSHHTGRFYSLMPTAAAPTLLLSGIPMHRIKDTDPFQDTLSKVAAIRPVTGRVLDTATGLGYTASEAAKTAEQVVTIELDPAVLSIARLNPWSRELFENPRIVQMTGDSYELVAGLESASFTRILHDPPTFSIAGDLYSGIFYAQLYRVLRKGGKLFHYIGDLESDSGRRVSRGVVRRLGEAGFTRIQPRPEAFGLVAQK